MYEEKNKETIDKMRKEAMEELEEIEEAIIQEEIDNDEMGDVEEITGFPRRVE